ncbi:LPS export ABC transporter periplasmic protein LptC [Croceitalea rosinachiae]|uniref:LPS export ABC transporter periplasmic protein LptC n=1 Tax=Croceitalea rosinachiae TaxID=3075596 RepID=A0ABU3A983_9FLAO|nr:LPS export ABC transporter periplasmic protein LptC [Croceitalea sp. F388]MDT0606745.1 LPS export ABC transporter periplasmic protein LptC [Croceitalea sp. F388]
MKTPIKYYSKRFATVFTVAILFLGCGDNYKRVGEEAATNIYPQGVAKNFVLTYTEAVKELSTQDSSVSRVVAILKSPINKDFDNLSFGYKEFPEGLQLDFFNEKDQKSVIVADYAIIYSKTSVIDLQGNVVLTSHDGKKLETPQLFYDRGNKWIFTEEKFTYTNPEDGTVMDGEGMDFNREFTFFNAHKTFGLMTISEE